VTGQWAYGLDTKVDGGLHQGGGYGRLDGGRANAL